MLSQINGKAADNEDAVFAEQQRPGQLNRYRGSDVRQIVYNGKKTPPSEVDDSERNKYMMFGVMATASSIVPVEVLTILVEPIGLRRHRARRRLSTFVSPRAGARPPYSCCACPEASFGRDLFLV